MSATTSASTNAPGAPSPPSAPTSRNAVKHGYCASLSLSAENTEEAAYLDRLYQDHLAPTTPMELFFAQTMAVAHARVLHIRRDTRDILELRLLDNKKSEERFLNLDPAARAALAFDTEAARPSLPLAMRYERDNFRFYERSWRALAGLRPDIQQPPDCFRPRLRHRGRPPRPPPRHAL